MPIDFARVPPRVSVPPPPRPSVILWAILLVLMIAAGAGLTVLLWAAGEPSGTPWFWCCAIVYPILAWAFLLCCWLGGAYARRSEAMAINRVSNAAEQQCHAQASKPLAVLAYAWCFSADERENGAEGIVNGGLQLGTRPSAAEPGTDVSARWLEVPGRPFFPGNALTEYARHRVVCDWLLGRLVDRVGDALAALPAHTVLQVDLCAKSAMDLADVQARLQALILARAPTLQVAVNVSEEHFSLFRVDAWHDSLKPREVRLLIALQLRKAISERLQDGVAEAGVALLLSRPGTGLNHKTSLQLHRPAKGAADGEDQPFALAMRWGQTAASHIKTIWSHVLTEDLNHSVKYAPQLSQDTQWIDVGTSVGNCDGAGAWLAAALAMEHAKLTANPQLVLSEQDGDLVALVCTKPT